MSHDRDPIVSVIIPVYNIASFLSRCLDSLLCQTLTQIEILCIDDASEDDSVQIVRDFQQRDSRVRLLQQAHQGVSAARNLGISHSRGKYIAFVDGDDWVEADMLEKMAAAAQKASSDVVLCSAQVYFEQQNIRDVRRNRSLQAALTVNEGLWTGGNVWELIDRPGCWPFIWNKLIRRELICKNDIQFTSGLPLGEDGIFVHLLVQYASRVSFLPDGFYHYRYQRRSSATVRLFQNETVRFGQHIEVARSMLQEFSRRDFMAEQGGHLLRWLLTFLYPDFVSLPAVQRKNSAQALRDVFEQYDLLRFNGGLKPFQRRRLANMLAVKDCTRIKRVWDIVSTKIENRIMRIFC